MKKMVEMNTVLVKKLICEQFPHWAEFPVRPVKNNGWDNRTFHLGDEYSVRLPSHQRYAAQVKKEQHWLPFLGPQLPLSIPVPVAMGKPSEVYPFHWSIYRWIEGENTINDRIHNVREYAETLALFLTSLYAVDARNGPPAGVHNFHRGGSLRVYHQETMETLQQLEGRMDTSLAEAVWREGLQPEWMQDPVWVHGDIAASNLLLKEGKLSAVIDFGCMGVGDPACDLTIAWTLFDKEGRRVFREALAMDDQTWARSRSWAMWKALIVFYGNLPTNTTKSADANRVLQKVMEDYLEK